MMDGKMLGNIALTRCLNVIGEPTTVLFKKRTLPNRSEYTAGSNIR
ncbi:hypothetical protein P7H16_18530 [Paenibacillus larvae]|nr:hypothetical protein [Paenibacillus larvae]MDT2242726.1 hypothetical protein [Paenibacillus larvae]MDT2248510.1 hypothetical protein [Paenibacillus larvae]MDT2257936.1 hypothetical protein [Paenibacillus larvae]MDT2260333.1 hypothetical protein [Paenibacillus larvae]MDT2275853.1 hypothetical protein [Paenibacillus larvae]